MITYTSTRYWSKLKLKERQRAIGHCMLHSAMSRCLHVIYDCWWLHAVSSATNLQWRNESLVLNFPLQPWLWWAFKLPKECWQHAWTYLDRLPEMSLVFTALRKIPISRCARNTLKPGQTGSSAAIPRFIATIQNCRQMATVKDSIPHVVRTAADQRQRTLYGATIGRIEQVNSTIRLLRLYLDNDQVRSSLTNNYL